MTDKKTEDKTDKAELERENAELKKRLAEFEEEKRKAQAAKKRITMSDLPPRDRPARRPNIVITSDSPFVKGRK